MSLRSASQSSHSPIYLLGTLKACAFAYLPYTSAPTDLYSLSLPSPLLWPHSLALLHCPQGLGMHSSLSQNTLLASLSLVNTCSSCPLSSCYP